MRRRLAAARSRVRSTLSSPAVTRALYALLFVCVFSVTAWADWPESFPTQAEINARYTAQQPFSPDGWLDGTGYPEPRRVLGAQWHTCKQQIFALNADGTPNLYSYIYDFNTCQHAHVEVGLQRTLRGWTCWDVRLFAFDYQGSVFDQLNLTWRGGPYVKRLPTVFKSTVPGKLQVLITEPMQTLYVPVCLDTRSDPYDGSRAPEFDLQISRKDTVPAMARLLGCTVYVANGNPTTKLTGYRTDGTPIYKPASVSGKCGAEGWTSKGFNGEPATFPYVHLEESGFPQFDTDPLPVSASMTGAENGFPPRDLFLMATIDPDLHARPTNYGQVLMGNYPAPHTVPKPDGGFKWLPVTFTPPAIAGGHRYVFRVSDSGLNADGSDTLHDGAAAVLFSIKVGKGQ